MRGEADTADDSPRLAVRHDLGHCVTVRHDGRVLLTYVYAPGDAQMESPRPYFHPMHTLDGELVSLCRPHDHVWHKGLAWSLPHVGPHNFWGGPTYVRGEGYVQLDNDGSMDHEAFTELSAEDGVVRIGHELTWRAQPGAGQRNGDAVVREQRDVRIRLLSDDAWVLVFTSCVTNISDGPLDLGSPNTNGRENAGYGGLFWRGPRSFTGGTVLATGIRGGDDMRGVRAPWLAFTGRHDGTGGHSTLVWVDDATNPRHPPRWFVRTEEFACVNPAPFFDAEIPFRPDETLRFRYALVVADQAADETRATRLAEAGQTALEECPS